VQHADNADFVTGETGVWGFSALTVGLNVGFYRAATPGLPVQVAMQRGVRMYHDQTTRPLADIRWELLSLLAHGAFVTIVDKTGFDGGLDSVTYERIGKAFSEAQAKREHFGQELLADVGIYYSHRTRDWVGREKPGEYFAAFQGTHKAFVYDHIPWGVVLDENVTLETLKSFAVVVLPNAGILSEAETFLFLEYVKGGGNLIITGRTGCYDRMGSPASQSILEELIGARLVAPLESLDNWVMLSEEMPEAIRSGILTDWPFLVKGPAVVYEATTAAAYGKLMKPYRTTRQMEGKEGTEWPMSADAPVGPALLVNHIGNGVVFTLAVSPDYATFSDHHVVEARKLLVNAVRFLQPSPRVRISAPVTVQATVSDDPGERILRVHLLGYNTAPQTTPAQNRPYILPALIEEAPLYRFGDGICREIKQVSAVNPETAITMSGNTISGTVNDIHEVIVLRY